MESVSLSVNRKSRKRKQLLTDTPRKRWAGLHSAVSHVTFTLYLFT